MTKERISDQLYLELLKSSGVRLMKFLERYPRYETQLSFDIELNPDCLLNMYERQRYKNPKRRQEFWTSVPKLKDACSKCWKFYLNPRNTSIKSLDIKFGKEFEKSFSDFLNQKGYKCERGDIQNTNYPDLMISLNQNPVCYLELKYLAAPFLMVYKKIPERECYEGSTTLDSGAKIEAQRKIVEREIHVPVFYVYWIDFPCLKGIFFMKSQDVYMYIDKVAGNQYTRKDRRGDYVNTPKGLIRIAELNKVYLPLLEMGNFEELLSAMNALITDNSR